MLTPVDFSYEEIAPLIRVYKNLLPSHADLTETLNKMIEITLGNMQIFTQPVTAQNYTVIDNITWNAQ